MAKRYIVPTPAARVVSEAEEDGPFWFDENQRRYVLLADTERPDEYTPWLFEDGEATPYGKGAKLSDVLNGGYYCEVWDFNPFDCERDVPDKSDQFADSLKHLIEKHKRFTENYGMGKREK